MKRKICFDACIFIALMKPNEFADDVITSIHTLMADIQSGKVYAVVPTIIAVELLDGSMAKLEPLCDGRKGEFVDADLPITTLARTVRTKITRKEKGGPKLLSVPDAIYIATAIHYKCDCLVTTDGLGNNKHSPLSAADDIKKTFKLRVCHPIDAVDQKVLDLRHEGGRAESVDDDPTQTP